MRTLSTTCSFALCLLLVAIAPAQEVAEQRAPSKVDIAYGPHERNKFDLWLAESDEPTPLLIFIHGGGFIGGDKTRIRGNPAIEQALSAGVSFASLNYRFRQHAPIQDILRDAARAVQFIRSEARQFNIDPQRIACYGGSAGAGTSLWLAFHDDLADPDATDPVLRQSSRIIAAGSLNGQATYDLRKWDAVVGPAAGFQRTAAERLQFYGFDSAAEAATPEADRIMADCDMLGLITKDDPPVALASAIVNEPPTDRNSYVHHPKHAIAVADRCKEAGIETLLVLREGPRRRASQSEQVVAFLIEKLKADDTP